MNENIKIVRNDSETVELINWLALASGPISFDIETTGLNVRKDKVIGFSISDGITGWYVVHLEWTGSELLTAVTYDKCKEVLHIIESKKLLTWNGSFDTRTVYYYFKVDLIKSIYCDVMLQKHTVNENALSYALKDTAAQLFGADSKQAQTDLMESVKSRGGETKGDMYKAESSIIAAYGAQDALLTHKSYQHYQQELEQQGLTKFFYDDEVMPLYREVTIPMELSGIPVDVPFMQKSLNEITEEIDKLEHSIQTKIAPYLTDFNQWYIDTKYPFKLTGRFKTALGAKIAHELWPKTDSGAVSLNKTDINKAQNYTATEIKRGSQRPLLPKNTLFEQIVNQQVHCPPDLVREVQLQLLREDGVTYPFNLKSKDHLKRLFFGYGKTKSVLNEKALSYTDKGAPQVDDDFIELMSRKYDWAHDLHVFNKLNKIKSTYIEAYLTEQEDGIFYPSFFQHRTTSGRYSSDAQQLPRKKNEEEIPEPKVREFTNRIRDFFISKENWSLIDADYTSLEVVVFADDSQDEALLDVIRKDYDLYSQVAINAFGLKEYSADKTAPNFLKKHKPNARQQAKAFALGFRYGLGPYKLSKELNIDEKTAATIRDNYFKSFPKLKQRMDTIVKNAKLLGYVKSKAGRIRHLPELKELSNKYGDCIFDSLELYKKYSDNPAHYNEMKIKSKIAKNLLNNSLNFPIQSLAASIVSQSSIAISREFKSKNMKAYITLSVHDEVVIHAPDNEVDAVKEIMRRCMENTIKLSVPLTAEPISGKVYGDVK